jgi:hypothetical protein
VQNIFSGLQCFRTDGRNRLYSGAFFNLLCVFKDTRAKAFSDFLFFIFYFCFCVLYSICIFSVRCGAVRGRVANWCTYIARCLCCLSYCARAFIQVLRCPHKNAKKSEARGGIAPPPAEKKVVSVAGVGSPNRYTAPTLLSSNIFLYLCIIKPYYISYG